MDEINIAVHHNCFYCISIYVIIMLIAFSSLILIVSEKNNPRNPDTIKHHVRF